MKTEAEEAPPSVIVVGAGAAGLSAARALTKNGGIRVIVLEARERMGGRIDTRRLADGTCVDMGAAWLHGVGPNNPLTQFAFESSPDNLCMTDWDNAITWEAVGSSQGAVQPSPLLSAQDDEEGNRLMRLTWGVHKAAQSTARSAARQQLDDSLAADEGLWPSLCRLRTKRFPGMSELSERQKYLLRFKWAQETEQEYAAPLERLSASWWDIDDDNPGQGDALWRGGLVELVEQLAEGLEDVRLGQRVCRIAWLAPEGGERTRTHEITSEGHEIASEGDERTRHAGVEVTLATGERLVADACIVTLPLGVLQRGHVTFTPPLSKDKLAALRRLGFGLLNKAVLRFDRCFWSEGARARGGATPVAEAHVFERVPLCASRAAPEALEVPIWINLHVVTGTPALVAYFDCETARRMEAWSDAQVGEHCVALLATMFGDEALTAATLVECIVSRWESDELACGSYSYLPAGSTPYDRVALARAEPPLFFAGEATSHGTGPLGEGGYPSTVHGAYLSGARAAAEVCKELGMGPKSKRKGKRRTQGQAILSTAQGGPAKAQPVVTR